MQKKTNTYFSKYLDFVRKNNLYPQIHSIEGASSSPKALIDGEDFLTFSSNNYLSLAKNKEIVGIVSENVEKYGVGSGSTRLLSGTLDLQVEFEKKLAKFLGFDDSITFSSGYLANVGVIRMLVDPFPYFSLFPERKGIIISDELNHASIIDGVRLSKSEKVVYKHSDMADLEKILKKYKNRRKLILTDGIFSMDGDMADLKNIVKLAHEYDALTMVDDSHGVGVLGPNGEGTAHHLGVAEDVDIIMGSFTKGFGSIGGFISANQDICDYLRITARSYIFSDPIIPAVVAGLIKSLDIIENEKDRRKGVLDNADYLRKSLRKVGFTVLGEESTIVPILIGSEDKAIEFYELLSKNRILAPCIRRPAVKKGKERIRFSVMTNHTKEQLDKLISVCGDIGKELKILN